MSIEKRHLVTGALLAFVAVTGVTLAVKETRHARAVAAAEAARPAGPAPLAANSEAPPESVAASSADTAPATEVAQAPVAPAPAAPVAAAPRPAPPAAKAPVPQPAAEPSTIYVTYFHATARCASCLKIEDLTNATMTMRFAGPIAEKRIVWRLVNVDEPEHAHFVKDYGLFTKSVVVSEVRAGKEVRWKNLDQVWHLLGDPDAFQGYVEREVRAWLEKA